jgi:hypothetical protein
MCSDIKEKTVEIYILESVAISRGNSENLYITVGSDIKGENILKSVAI